MKVFYISWICFKSFRARSCRFCRKTLKRSLLLFYTNCASQLVTNFANGAYFQFTYYFD